MGSLSVNVKLIIIRGRGYAQVFENNGPQVGSFSQEETVFWSCLTYFRYFHKFPQILDDIINYWKKEKQKSLYICR